jgi:BON domain-containing protein
MFAQHSNGSLSSFLRGAAYGAAAMYILDPDKGRRRRAIARDKAASFLADAGETVREAARDITNRAQGARARAWRSLHRDEIADDLRLIERVRARIGRVVTHPHAIQVGARDGHVTLSGPILAGEVQALVAAVRAVPGVSGVDEHLAVYAHSGSVPSLQGAGRRRGGQVDLLASDASPVVRAAALVAGGFLVLYGLTHRSASGLALASVGAGLAARGARRLPRNDSSDRNASSSEQESGNAFEAIQSAGDGTV